MNNKIAIIIVNWNGQKYLQDCLESVYKQTYTNFDVYFVDNGSKDDSISFVINNFPNVKIIKLEKNTGFAYANNIGICKAFEDDDIKYILTLNNDTKADKTFLSNLILHINSGEFIGSVASKMKYFYEENLLDNVGFNFDKTGRARNIGSKEKDEGQYNNSNEVFGACAGAALYRREALESVVYDGQYFDNIFFAYYEDVDLAFRLRLVGWKCMSCSTAVVYHVHSATGNKNLYLKNYYLVRNRIYMIIKNMPIQMTHLIFRTVHGGSSGAQSSGNKMGILRVLGMVCKLFFDLMFNLPNLLVKRSFIQKRRTVNVIEVKKSINISYV